MFKVVRGIFVIVCLWTLNACSPKVSKSTSSTTAAEKPATPAPPANVAPVATPAIMHEPLMKDTDQPKPVPANTLPMEKVKDK